MAIMKKTSEPVPPQPPDEETELERGIRLRTDATKGTQWRRAARRKLLDEVNAGGGLDATRKHN